jgi:hypothetical protein
VIKPFKLGLTVQVCTRESALVQKGSNAPTIALWSSWHVSLVVAGGRWWSLVVAGGR